MKHLLDTRVGPYQAMIPMVDVDTIGAGGGSIAYVDSGGIFRSGPRSAGASPAPPPTAAAAPSPPPPTRWSTSAGCCRGLPRRRHGAQRPSSRARRSSGWPGTLGMTIEEASMGAVQIASHSMVQSIEENSVRKGFDPRDFALVAEGGAGPAFAATSRVEVGTPAVSCRRTRASPRPWGCSSPTGLRVRRHDLPRLSELNAEELRGAVHGARGAGPRAAGGGRHPEDRRVIQRVADCRYLGQGYELRVDVPRARSTTPGSRQIRPTSTTPTSASTRAASRTRTSRSPTSGCAASGSSAAGDAGDRAGRGDRPDALRHERKAWFQVDGELAGRDAVLRTRGAQGGQPDRGPRGHQPVRLHHGGAARA